MKRPADLPRHLRATLLGLALLASLASCGAPARVSRSAGHARLAEPSRESSRLMAELLREALRDPATPASTDALGHFVERWNHDCGQASAIISSPGAPGRPPVAYRVRFAPQREGCYAVDYFDRISPADDFTVRGIQHHLRPGVGTPLTALRENRQTSPLEKHFPPEAIARAVTAVIEPGPAREGTRDVTIRLLCPLRNDRVTLNGRSQPLAADFSVPWAMLLERTGGLKRAGFLDVLLTRSPKREPRLYLMEPYDPNKEPLIMIHGLFSTPLAFANLSNELWADDAIRHRYQIWHYLYNTSAPALYSARILRGQLRELRPLLNPDGRDPAMRRTTLLTHSMGGIIGKALATEPGEAFWKAALTVPHEKLKASPQDKATLQDAFEWKADPTIRRIVFIAVPHRGSDFADNAIGRLGRWLTSPPAQFTEFYRRIMAQNPGAFAPPYEAMWRGKLDSVSSLSPRMPTLQILSQLPFAHPVQAHSIIGNRGRPGPLEQSSDGIVPYASSHLDHAASELVVPYGHGAFRHPDALKEIKRVLLLP